MAESAFKFKKILSALSLMVFLACLADGVEGAAGTREADKAPPRAGKDWKVTASASYETGTYGTDTRVDTIYLPVTVKRYFERAELSVTVPYISAETSSQFTVVNGMVFKFRPAPGAVRTNSGMGDLVLRGGYYAWIEGKGMPFDLTLVGRIKVPTASESEGLGTGEFDETAGVEFAKQIPGGWTGYLDLYYAFIGDPPGVDLEDRFSFDIGLSKAITPEMTGSVFYEESTPLVSGEEDLRDIMANIEYRVDGVTSVFGGVTLGLSDTSPDYGLSAGVSVRF